MVEEILSREGGVNFKIDFKKAYDIYIYIEREREREKARERERERDRERERERCFPSKSSM